MAGSRMNLTTLQQRDPYITSIVATASQVALYSFCSRANAWRKTSVEGSLFVYQRSASPLTGFMILNRLGLNNLVEPITKDLEFQHQDPFLLYRNAKSIYGIWFYDKDECRRLGDLLNRYLQVVLDKHSAKRQGSPTSRRRGSNGEVMHAPTKASPGPVGPSQVDIMQMLSRAQQEYNTNIKIPSANGRSQIEPKPMIDNPNASAMKANNIIRPMPVKIPDGEQASAGCDEPTTPGTAPISLDALFRTASLQQHAGPKFPPADMQVATKPAVLGRSVSIVAEDGNDYSTDRPPGSGDGDIAPLLKHIMSTGSMVEDIERGQVPAGAGAGATPAALRHSVSEKKLSQFLGGVPDLTQPPPTHPAYRGPSPKAVNKGPSPLPTSTEHSPKTASDHTKVTKPNFSLGPSATTSSTSQIISGNLISQFTNAGQRDSKSISVTSRNTSTNIDSKAGTPITSWASADSLLSKATSVGKTIPSPVGSKALLTPADLVQSSSTPAVSSGTSSHTGKQSDLSLAAAAASLSTELLTPMAFTTPAVRKTPPASQSLTEDKSRELVDSLPIAALTREQLQQSLLYLIKNDSQFISTLHEAYLKSIQELSGQKS